MGFFSLRMEAQLPPSKHAPAVGQKAPEFVLPDSEGKPTKLLELLAPARPADGQAPRAPWVLLVFYRGYW